jgi:hypothetical protein
MEKLAAIVPQPRAHLVRYGGCLAPHSKLRTAIIPTPRQQGVDGDETKTGTPYWNWARLLGRVFDLAMATCLPPLRGRREARRRAAPTQSRQALRPFPLPLPQPAFTKRDSCSTKPTQRESIDEVRAAAVYFPPSHPLSQLPGNRPSRDRRPSKSLQRHATPF